MTMQWRRKRAQAIKSGIDRTLGRIELANVNLVNRRIVHDRSRIASLVHRRQLPPTRRSNIRRPLLLQLSPLGHLGRFVDQDRQTVATEPDRRRDKDLLRNDVGRGQGFGVVTLLAPFNGEEVGAVGAEIVNGESLGAVNRRERACGVRQESGVTRMRETGDWLCN